MIEAWGRGFDKIKEACEKYLKLLSAGSNDGTSLNKMSEVLS